MEADAGKIRVLAPDSVDPFYLHLAAKTGNVHRLRLLVAAQFPPSEETKKQLLAFAVHGEQIAAVNFLLKRYRPISTKPQIKARLLSLAVEETQIAAVELLLKYYLPIRVESEVLHSSILSGSETLVSALLSTDPFIINRQFAFGGTPLITACESGQQPEFLKFLLECGADPNTKCATSKLSALECLAGASQLLCPGNRAIDSIALMLNSRANIKRPEVLMAAVRGGAGGYCGLSARAETAEDGT